MAPVLSLLIPFALPLFIASSKAVPTGYFCSSAASHGGTGTISIYDTSSGTNIGCLDERFRWVVDGSCAVYTMTNYNGYYFSTAAARCSLYPDPSVADGYVYWCGPPPNPDLLTFKCDMTRYEGHAAFSQRAYSVPTGSEKVNITFQKTAGAPGFEIELRGVMI